MKIVFAFTICLFFGIFSDWGREATPNELRQSLANSAENLFYMTESDSDLEVLDRLDCRDYSSQTEKIISFEVFFKGVKSRNESSLENRARFFNHIRKLENIRFFGQKLPNRRHQVTLIGEYQGSCLAVSFFSTET